MLGKAISGPLFKILGLDRFTKGKAMSGMARAGRGQNPFDMGVAQVSTFGETQLGYMEPGADG